MRRILVAVVAVLTCSGGFARGADILAVNYDCFLVDHCRDNNPASILIRGTITEGDSAKFRNIIVQSGFPVVTVILRSNGGNVQEAMKIGRDIRKLLLETEGPQLDYYPDRDGSLSYGSGDHPLCIENGMGEFKGSRYKASECVCASACFFLYVAGARRDRSYVGIRRGYLSEDVSRDLGLDTATQIYKSIDKPISEYLDEMGVPHRYADIMLRTSSQEIYVPKLPEVMADFYGWIPEIEEWLIAKCNTVSERQLEEEKNKAFEAGQLLQFFESRDRRETCIQVEVAGERAKRRTEYQSAILQGR